MLLAGLLLIMIIFVIIIQKNIFMRYLTIYLLNLLISYYFSVILFFKNWRFNYNILRRKSTTLINNFDFKKLFTFFQFGSKKQSYFRSWFDNIKKKKNWTWRWRK